jgi:hypothetical protein
MIMESRQDRLVAILVANESVQARSQRNPHRSLDQLPPIADIDIDPANCNGAVRRAGSSVD